MLVSRHSKQEPSPKPRAHSAQQWARYTPAPDTGLSEEQVQQRRNEGPVSYTHLDVYKRQT